MIDNIVTINNNQYKYTYDPKTQNTHYLGPVGDSPPLTEEEFLVMVTQKKLNKTEKLIKDKYGIELMLWDNKSSPDPLGTEKFFVLLKGGTHTQDFLIPKTALYQVGEKVGREPKIERIMNYLWNSILVDRMTNTDYLKFLERYHRTDNRNTRFEYAQHITNSRAMFRMMGQHDYFKFYDGWNDFK